MTGALLVSGAIGIYFTYRESRAAAADLQHEKAVAAAARIEQYVGTIEKGLRLAALPQIDAGDVQTRRIEFNKLLRQAPEVFDIAQLDGSGHELVAVSRLDMDATGTRRNRSAESGVREARPGRTWFGPVYFRKETEPFMRIAVRSGGEDGPVTIADINLKFIWDIVSRIHIGEQGKAYVVDPAGYLVADPDIGLVLRKTSLKTLPHVEAALHGADVQAMPSHDVNGAAVLASSARIEPLGWMVFAEQPASEVNAKLNASIVRTGLLIVGGLMVSALAALLLARRMAHPIRTLTEGAQRIGTGDLAQRLEVRTGDELEALAQQFNRMTGQLRESYAGLERKVEERTAALQRSLEQQTAISEILRVISSSPTNVQPVLDAVAERAAKLCSAPFARVLLVDGDMLRPGSDFSADGQSLAPPPAPIPLQRTVLSGRAVLERRTMHLADIVPLLDTEYPDSRGSVTALGARAALSVPLVSGGAAYGSIFLFRRSPGLFTAHEVALVETFAQQAAIAIDNVRLFNETREALDQQRASGEVLSAVSSSIADTTPVFDVILASCERLFAGLNVGVLLARDGMFEIAAYSGPGNVELNGFYPRPIDRSTGAGIAALERRIVMYPDTQAEDVPPVTRAGGRAMGNQSLVVAPMLFQERVLGALWVGRGTKGPFTDKQVSLLRTFADQAVIAIQNARLFNETKEALEQQTAIADILRVISSSPTDVQPVLDAIAEQAARLCDAASASMYLTDGSVLRHLASRGPSPDPVEHVDAVPISRESLSGRALLDRVSIQVADMLAEEDEYPVSYALAQQLGHRSVVVTPLLREDKAFGTILLRRNEVRPFNEREIALLRTFGDQAAIALENVRLFNETKEALERQTATTEVLRAISRTTFDLQPVLDMLIENATRMCKAENGHVLLRKGDVYKFTAHHGATPEFIEFIRDRPLPVDEGSAVGRAALTRNTVHIHDALAEPGYTHPEYRDLLGFRTILAVPMLREGEPIGVLAVWRAEVRPFAQRDIDLVAAFADQAVIAIENVRLFNETREALDQQRAAGEVLAAISNSIADTTPVFERILYSCERLFGGKVAGVNLVDPDGLIRLRAYHGPNREELERVFPLPVDMSSGSGACIVTRSIVHYPDTGAPDVPQATRIACQAVGYKAVIFAPMVWENRGIGVIYVGRDVVGEFSDKDIALLKTFADQAVIAIQNARLFREIQEKSRQLQVANQHKSEFLANMSHELRTPLNAVIGFSEVLLERLFGDINAKQEDYLKDIHSSGRHLLSLINDILDLSKIEAGRMELELSTFDLPAAVSNAMTLVRERAERHGIKLGTALDPSLGAITADERKLKQILVNLLSNAVKFTPDGGRVDLAARAQDGHAIISVADTGIGIAPEDQPLLFEEFRQVGRHAGRQEGTGLGLTLTKRFVELHGGHIAVASTPGKGSTFTFDIPLKPIT